LKAQAPPVKTIAQEAALPVLQPEKAREPKFVTELAQLRPEIIVVVAYGQILTQTVLDLPKFGCINVHASLLPKYRGAAPIQWAILNNEAETGVSIMKMTAGLDTGDVLSQRATPIGPDETADLLHDRLAGIGAELLMETLPLYVAGSITPQPQDHAASTYARKISKEDGRLDWSRPALELRTRMRAFTPWPGAFVNWSAHGRPRLLKIWRAQIEQRQGRPGEILEASKNALVVACGTDALRIEQLQLEGGRKMTAAEFLAGHELRAGDSLAGV
jgi:methionyl-tRNA formyltransferase